MDVLKLNDGHALAIENMEKEVRLVLYNNGVENVCRKLTLKTIRHFIQPGENHLFKGRLQLYKNDHHVSVQAKGSIVGKIPLNNFITYLQTITP